MNEADLLVLLRPLATHPAARGLNDDAAVLGDLVFTHDVLVEGVHFRLEDAPQDVAWKLIAVNLSDLAAKGAAPIGVLLGYPLGDDAWDAGFVEGLAGALAHFDVALLGGDTVSARGARSLSLTAIGQAGVATPSRSGAQTGDALYVTGVIGLAGLGLRMLEESSEVLSSKKRPSHPSESWDPVTPDGTSMSGDPSLRWDDDRMLKNGALRAYLRPMPRLAEGQALAPLVHAMMDVSDGLLIDAQRMATASGLAVTIDLDAVPVAGNVTAAVVAGDDYELLFAAPGDVILPVAATRIGRFATGTGLTLTRGDGPVRLPDRLGWLHE